MWQLESIGTSCRDLNRSRKKALSIWDKVKPVSSVSFGPSTALLSSVEKFL